LDTNRESSLLVRSKQILNGSFLLLLRRLNVWPDISIARVPGQLLRILDAVLPSDLAERSVATNVN